MDLHEQHTNGGRNRTDAQVQQKSYNTSKHGNAHICRHTHRSAKTRKNYENAARQKAQEDKVEHEQRKVLTLLFKKYQFRHLGTPETQNGREEQESH